MGGAGLRIGGPTATFTDKHPVAGRGPRRVARERGRGYIDHCSHAVAVPRPHALTRERSSYLSTLEIAAFQGIPLVFIVAPSVHQKKQVQSGLESQERCNSDGGDPACATSGPSTTGASLTPCSASAI